MKKTLILLAALTITVPAYSQEEKRPNDDPKFYKLDFVVKELEGGKVLNSRSYTMSISPAPHFDFGSIRTGDKVPVGTGKDGAWTYVDVGVNIDCRQPREVAGQLAMQVSAEVSSIASFPANGHPVIDQKRWNASVIVPVGKPTTIFSSDGAATKRQIQFEVTATPIR